MIIDTHVHVIVAHTARYLLVEEARGAGWDALPPSRLPGRHGRRPHPFTAP
ncbi:MAG: hypothetical protein U0531_21710 [Dehalococcoidia bacterium]